MTRSGTLWPGAISVSGQSSLDTDKPGGLPKLFMRHEANRVAELQHQVSQSQSHSHSGGESSL